MFLLRLLRSLRSWYGGIAISQKSSRDGSGEIEPCILTDCRSIANSRRKAVRFTIPLDPLEQGSPGVDVEEIARTRPFVPRLPVVHRLASNERQSRLVHVSQ